MNGENDGSKTRQAFFKMGPVELQVPFPSHILSAQPCASGSNRMLATVRYFDHDNNAQREPSGEKSLGNE